MKKRIKITETVLRDAHQSLMATRMRFEDMEPILPLLDKAGYGALECWGGATFDACLRYLNEDPWERLRKIKALAPTTPLQMLLRGQNLIGYRHYGDDVVRAFVDKASENGVDIFRIFDALNDFRNIQTSVEAVKAAGKVAQVAMSYTTSPIHTIDYYVQKAQEVEALGADEICIKDMAGILTPDNASQLVGAIKSNSRLPLVLHTHSTTGIASMTYLRAVEAGVDQIDTAISPLSEGTSQPPTESMVLTLEEMGYDTGLKMADLERIGDHFRQVRDKYLKDGTLDPRMLTPDPRAVIYQVPGGMLSNMRSQLGQAKMEDKFEAVLKEVPLVRAELGYPPLVTPLSQMVGTQATMNVISGQRYKMVSKEVKNYLLGKYGKSPMPIDEVFRKEIIGDQEVIHHRPADDIGDELGGQELEGTMEEQLTKILFPDLALPKAAPQPSVRPAPQAEVKVIKAIIR